MADTPDLSNIRTLSDLTHMVSLLFFNMNRMNELYYTIFLDPEPKTVELERYDENGTLVKVSIDNRAKDRKGVLSGPGSPDGKVVAGIGSFYIDTNTGNIYYKSSGSDAYGWMLMWTQSNFIEGEQYLSPTGDGSRVTSLNADNISSGILKVERGGTAFQGFSGLARAAGQSPYYAAVDGIDYLGPAGMIGIVCWYPVINNGETIPTGWLRCDGSAYSSTLYKRLYDIIGNTYGSDGEGTFRVPDLMDRHIRGWRPGRGANELENDGNKSHSHGASGLTIGSESNHKHSPGDYEITGTGIFSSTAITKDAAHKKFYSGAIYMSSTSESYPDVNDGSTGTNGGLVTFKASRAWTGYSGSGSSHTHSISGSVSSSGNSETTVKNLPMIPIIKY